MAHLKLAIFGMTDVGRVRQNNEDASVVADLTTLERVHAMASAVTLDESDYKNVILQAIGLRPEVTVEMSGVQLGQHDRVLLCSDGLSNMLSDGDMHALLAGGTVDAVCRTLVDTANARGGEDNITVVVLDVAGEAEASPAHDV